MSSNDPFLDLPELNECVRRVREHSDKRAFEVIFKTYHQRLHGFASTMVHCPSTSEDIIQTVFLNIWMNRSSWDPPGDVKTYLFRAVKNECLNMIRHDRVVTESLPRVREMFDSAETMEEKEFAGAEKLMILLEEETMNLPAACRTIFLLSRDHGLTYREIADYLDISINTVNTQMGRALKRIRAGISRKINVISFAILAIWPFS